MTFMFPHTYPPIYMGGLWGCCTTGETKVVELESVSTVVNIRGFVAQVNAKLLYHNSSDSPLQVRYTLPVDESAAVYKFEAHLDGRTIVAHCMEKKKAEKLYEEAVHAGKTAVLTRQDERSSDMLQLDLGNLPEGSKAMLSISLVMELRVQTDGGVSFVLPTVLNPRYCPAGGPTGPRGFGTELEQSTAVTVTKAYTIDIKAHVSGGHEIARIISHTDSLNVTISEDIKSAEVTQDGGFKSDHDWSLLLYYANPYKTHVLRETGDRSATGLMKDDLIMINLFPEVPTDSYSSKNEIIFLIDRSGSMQGEKIQSARATLLLFLKSLPMGCLFNVISFGSDFTALFPKSSEYNEETLAKACALQENMNADMGGTEILSPFQNIYSTAPSPGYARQMLLISDGEVYNVDQVTQLVARHAHETRVFAVGIGHGASTALIHGVARAGRGRSEMVIQQDRLQLKVMGLVSSMVQDSVQNVRVACEIEPTSSVRLVPKVPPIIFGGQHLTLYARVPSTSTVKALSIMGNIGDADLSISIKGSDIVSVHDSEMSLHRLAARAQINQWQLDCEEDVAEDMIALSIASGVVSKLTALVGVDEDGKPVERKRPETTRLCRFVGASSSAFGAGLCGAQNPPLPVVFGAQNPAPPRGFAAQNSTTAAGGIGGFTFGSNAPKNSPTPLSQWATFGSTATSIGCSTDAPLFGAQVPTGGAPLFGAQVSTAGAPLFGAQVPTAGAKLFGAQVPTAGTAGSGGFRFGSNASEKSPTPLSQNATFGSTKTPRGSGFLGARVPAGAPVFGAQVPTAGTAGSGGFGFGSNASEKSRSPSGSEDELQDQSLTCDIDRTAGYESEAVYLQRRSNHLPCVGAQVRGEPKIEIQSDDGSSDVDLLKIVSLQNFDGSWSLEDITKLCAKSCAQLAESNPSQNERAWATAVALALLESQFGDVRAEWSLLANKARLFISNCGEDVDDLVKKAQSFLATPE